MENRLEKLRLEVDRLIRENQPERDRYFFSHLYGVSHFCALLAARRNLNAEIAAVCGILHDIYHVIAGRTENHAVKGAEQAGSLLRALGLYGEDEIDIITATISRHSDKHIVHEPMAEVLKDADVMHHCLYYAANPVPENEIGRYTNVLVELGCTSMECKSYPFDTLGNYKYVDIMAVHKGKWIFCKHKELADIPSQWEMEKICLLDEPPQNLTYPDYTREIYPLADQEKKSIIDANGERFAIPGVGGLIIKDIDNIEHILLQKRSKTDAPNEDGLLEIPAGKIRAFENIFDTLKREIKEETGLIVTEIFGENKLSVYEGNSYKVINFMPFSCAQNTKGNYPIMVFVFVCRVTGDLLQFSDESKDYKWTPVIEIESMLKDSPQAFYPMHIDTLRKYVKTPGGID